MMDAHVERMLGQLSLKLSRRIHMYLRQTDVGGSEEWCNIEHARGCYRSDVDAIVADLYAIPHELVHAITVESGGSWWIEGIAYAFSGSPSTVIPDFAAGWYERRGWDGHLARWLVESYGGETYMELYEQTPSGSDQAAVEAAVREVLGQEFDAVLSEYAATSAYAYPDPWSCYRPPGEPESPWVGDFWEHEVAFDCDEANTFSTAVAERLRMTARVPITIPREAPYRFIADHPDAELFLQPCPEEPLFESTHEVQDWPIPMLFNVGAITLKPGPYVLLVDLPAGSPVAVRLAGYLSVD